MSAKRAGIWRTALVRLALIYGGLGLLITVLILVLPASYRQGYWSEEVFAGLSKRVLLLGGGLGAAWGACVAGFSSPMLLLFSAAIGLAAWGIGDTWPIAPPFVCAFIGLFLGSLHAEYLVEQVKTVRGYASKVDATGEERAQIIAKLLEAVGHPECEALWVAAAETLRLFGRDGTERLLKHLEHAKPKARRRAAQALGIIGESATIPSLQALAEKEQDAAVKQAVLEAISRIQAERPGVEAG